MLDPQLSPLFQAALLLVNAAIGLFMLTMSFSVRRLVKDLDDNTLATNRLAASIGELQTSIARFYVTKADFDLQEGRIARFQESMTGKYDTLNREMGELQARVGYAVKHKEY